MTQSAPRTITLDEIQAGDRIRVEWERDGVITTKEGVAHHLSDTGCLIAWYSEEAGRLTWPHSWPQTITLLDRPMPPLPTEMGSIIRVTEVWEGLSRPTGLYFRADRSTAPWRQIGGEGDWLADGDILAWNPVDIVDREA